MQNFDNSKFIASNLRPKKINFQSIFIQFGLAPLSLWNC